MEKEENFYPMENELGSPCLKKRRHSEKRHKKNESTVESEAADKQNKPETLFKEQNSDESKQDHRSTSTKHKPKIPKSSKKHQSEDNTIIPNEESNHEPVLDHSIPTIHQIVARVGQLESHMAVLTNSVAELQRNQSKMLKQIKTIKKQWNVVREAWTGQPNLNKKATLHKEEKSKKKKLKKGKCKKDKKDKKKDKLSNSKCSPVVESLDISPSVTPPSQPDISDNSSSSCSEQDLNNRIRAVLANILYETPPKKKK